MFYALANCSRVIGTVSLLFMVACTADVQTYEHRHMQYYNDEFSQLSKVIVSADA